MRPRETARRLAEAWRNREALQDLAELAASGDAELGRAIQHELQEIFEDAGRKPIGWKLGLTSQPALDLFGASEPMVGVIYADSLIDDGGMLSPRDANAPRIEGEMLLEIGTPPKSGSSDDELIASIGSVSAAFEIADSRIAGWPTAIGGAIADNACCSWLMRSPQSVTSGQADFENTAMSITRDGEVISEGRASACLGSVLEVYRWFVEDSHRRQRDLRPGQIILTGAMGPAIPMEGPANYRLSCTGLGNASLHFGDAS